MLAKERCDRIYAMIQEQGAVTTAKLVELFGVSTETIRKDLLFLERQGLLSKVHGGAVSKGDMRPFLELPERSKKQTPQKKELSLRAADFITDGDIIGIDSGSTAVMLAEVIRERFSVLTVITHSYDVFEILRRQPGFSVILCGGCYLPSENAFCGALTLDMLSRLHIKKLMKLGINRHTAWKVAYAGARIAYVCNKDAVNVAINNKRLAAVYVYHYKADR